MKVTNNKGLPQAFVDAVSVERHNGAGCFSATTLNKGTKEIVLTDRHFDDIEVDAADSVWAVWGTAVHKLMQSHDSSFLLHVLNTITDEYKNEKSELYESEFTYFERVIRRIKVYIKDKFSGNSFVEESFKLKVSNSYVTGTVDSYDLENGVINDWKTASVWKVQYADFDDWRQQGLTYAWLLSEIGLPVKKCRFVALLKDHSKTKARTDASYPQSPVFVYEFAVTHTDLAETRERIYRKVAEIETAYTMADDEIEPCTKAERWADDDKFAVMKEGRKSAVRVFSKLEDAETCAAELGAKHYIEHRPAVSRKCAEYCNACTWCNFYKNNIEVKE